MMKNLLLFLGCLISIGGIAQSEGKVTGFLGVYHTSAGFTYKDSIGVDSVLLQDRFRFGEMNLPSQLSDNGFEFHADVDSCNSWKANRVLGMIQPPSEGGIYNQPFDTALFDPFKLQDKPGMIQAAHRFSRLSEQFGPFCGVILDDWNGDTAITHQVRDAIQGKSVDRNGVVDYGSVASTPDNKLFAVIYYTWIDPIALPYMDGVSYWYVDSQNCCYANLERDIDQLRFNIPNKEIQIGIYIRNTHLGWTQPAGVHYMLAHALNSYDEGKINGITLFAGPFLLRDSMTLTQWNGYALPHWLDSVYYPFLGDAEGRLFDCETRKPLGGGTVRAFCKGRVSGDILLRSRQKTDTVGQYQLGVWAGNRNTDSTYYWIIAEKTGYDADSVGFWVKRNQHTVVPELFLCKSLIKSIAASSDLTVYPNPAGDFLTVNSEYSVNGTIEVKDLMGRSHLLNAFSGKQIRMNTSFLEGGYYFIQLRSTDGKVGVKKFVKR